MGNFRLDGEGRALYWAPYREIVERTRGILVTPGMQLTQDIMQPAYPICISLLSNNELGWTNFDYTGSDKRDTYFGLPPGKSAQIDFTISAGIPPMEIDISMVTEAILDRTARQSDQLWAAHFGAIEQYTNYDIHWVPLRNNPLHVLLINRDSKIDPAYEPRKHDKVSLTRNFFRIA